MTMTQSAPYKIGAATITRVSETILTTVSPTTLYPDWAESNLDADSRRLVLGPPEAQRTTVALHVHTWLVQIGGEVILIDTGIGNGKDRPFSGLFHQLQTQFLERLAALGIQPQDVGHVLLTHLHADHVGWNTRKINDRWVPTFPGATYVFAAAEQAFFATPAGASRRMVFDDSVQPVITAGQAMTMGEHGGRYLHDFIFHPTPGHSAGHMSISLISDGQEAIFTGDVAHNPIQVHRPDWRSVFCADPERARASRLWLLNHAADRDATLFTAHFPETSAGKVSRHGPGYAWTYV